MGNGKFTQTAPLGGGTGGGNGGGGLPTLGGWVIEASRFSAIGAADDGAPVTLAPYDPDKEYIAVIQGVAAGSIGALTLKEAANTWAGQGIGPVFVRNPGLVIDEPGLGETLYNAGSLYIPDGMLGTTTAGPFPVTVNPPTFSSTIGVLLSTPNEFQTQFLDTGASAMLFVLASRVVQQ